VDHNWTMELWLQHTTASLRFLLRILDAKARLIKGAKEIYYPGAPAWPDSHASDQVNPDLLDFLAKSQKNLHSSLNSRHRGTSCC